MSSDPSPLTYLDYLRATLPPQWTTDAAHIRLIAAHLDRVERGEIDRLAIHLPPRHGKSESVTYRFPVRWLERNPEHNVLVTGYNEQFARKFGRRSRNIAIERGLVGSTKAAVDEWETNAGGLYMCRGVGSPPTGTGFNLVCLSYNTLITTDAGLLPIGRIVTERLPVNVLTYDEKTQSGRWRPIARYEKSPGPECVRVAFSNGATVEATIDHPFYIPERGYVEAAKLNPGDKVVTDESILQSLRERVQSPSQGCRQKQNGAPVLQRGLFWRGAQRNPESLLPGKNRRYMRGMRQAFFGLSEHGQAEQQRAKVLLGRMPRQISSEYGFSTSGANPRHLPAMRHRILEDEAKRRQAKLLQPHLRQQGPQSLHSWLAESTLFARRIKQALSTGVQVHRHHNPGARWKLLQALWHLTGRMGEGIAGASHRLQQKQQCTREPYNSLHSVPRFDARLARQPGEMESTVVKTVEPVEKPEFVYNLNIPGEHNYFANGILTHNCIDDPIRRRADAESEIYRENVWDWYTDDLYTRLEPDGAIILIMTLWHHDDLGARAIASEPGRWTVLKLPAFAGANDPLGRRPGEALWPQRYSVADLTRTREVIRRKDGERSWEALYQQNPTPRSGSFFKTNKLEIVPAVPAGLRYVRAWDIAATENDGDYTVGVKMGCSMHPVSSAQPGNGGCAGSDTHGGGHSPVGDGIVYITDVQRGQWATDERDRIIRQTAELDGPGVRQRFPQDPGAAGKSQAAAFIRLLVGFAVKTVPVGGDKATRADPFSSQVNAGNVKLLKAEWNHATIEELRQFPNGKHDDQVDAASDAYEELAALPVPHFVV